MPVPQKIRYPTIFQHILFWSAFISYQILTYGWEENDQLYFKLALPLLYEIPVSMLLTYLNLYLLMPLFYYPQKYKWYGLSFLLLFFFGGILVRFTTHVFVLPWEQVHDPGRYHKEIKNFWIPIRILRNSFTIFPVVMVAMLIQLMRNAFRQQKNLREIEKEKFSAEMGLLKAQINPHFFFNTLNSLYGLTLKGSAQASSVVLQLSNLMHYMLYEASAAKVWLKDEINHLENYISIEQMRFSDRLDLSFQYSGDIEGKMIAPLLLLPFIENTFKHGLAEEAGWITISLKVIGNRLFLKVENSYSLISTPKGHGLGLKNVKRRLELTYPGQYNLEITQHDGVFEADLKLELS